MFEKVRRGREGGREGCMRDGVWRRGKADASVSVSVCVCEFVCWWCY